MTGWRYVLAVEADPGGFVWTVREVFTPGLSWSGPVSPVGDSRGDLLATLDLLSSAGSSGKVLDLTRARPVIVARAELPLASQRGWHR